MSRYLLMICFMRLLQVPSTSTLGICSSNMGRRSILLLIPLLLSGFTHLWNVTGFPPPAIDEGTYLGRAMNILEGGGPHDPYYGYDHPFLGQIFLSSIFSIIGYPDSFINGGYANASSLEILFFVPRALMGILAIFDTFLVYKISERCYNVTSAFIAATLFAVMPITWLTRWITLDSILLPFILLSILFAMKGKRPLATGKRRRESKDNLSNDILTIFLSGIFLGLAIFTKIPAAIMILPVGYLILSRIKVKRNVIMIFFIWLAPVILIPLIWLMYAVSVGQFDNWLLGVYEQANREKVPLSLSIEDFFHIDPILLILGISGIVLAAIRKDFFILLLTVPYVGFLYFVGFVTIFHLLPLIVGFSIASGALITYLSNKVTHNKKFAQGLPFLTIAVIGLIGIFNTSTLLVQDQTSQYFKAAAYINEYMQEEANNDQNGSVIGNKTTIVSNPFYLWIPKYKFHLDNYVEWGLHRIDSGAMLSVVDDAFIKAFDSNKDIDRLYKKIYDIYDTYEVERFESKSGNDSITILFTNLTNYNTNVKPINLLDSDHVWEPATDLKLSQNDSTLSLVIDTNSTGKEFNRAILNTHLQPTEEPHLLSLEYASNSSFGIATFLLQVKDKVNNKYWTQLLDSTSGLFGKEIFVLPDYIIGNPVEVRLTGVTVGSGQHTLVVKEAAVL